MVRRTPVVAVLVAVLVVTMGALVAPGSAIAAPAVGGAPALRTSSATTLITGDRVVVSTGAAASYALVRAQATGPGAAIHQFTLAGRHYVIPAVAQAYLGTRLDPSLFDVAALAATQQGNGELAVTVAHTGATPRLPGLTVTADRNGVANGYLTATSARAFGAALVTQWRADQSAGHPASTGLFAGVSRIAASGAPPVVTPNFPMHTLRITGIGTDGQTAAFGFGTLANMDDSRVYGAFIQIVNGQARVSVPNGHYAAVFDDFTFDETTGTRDAVVTVPAYTVSGDGQTLTYDARTSTVVPKVTTPRPLTSSVLGLTYDRTARDGGGFSSGYGGADVLTVNRTPAASVGSQKIRVTLTGNGGPAANPYQYDTAFDHAVVGASLVDHATAANLATVRSPYYADQPGRTGLFGRGADDEGFTFISLNQLTLGVQRLEYVGGNADTVWLESAAQNVNAFEDPGFIDAGPYTYVGGQTLTHAWLQPPLAAAIPAPVSASAGGFCYGCRTASSLAIGLAPWTDSTPDHTGELFGASDGTPVAHFRLTRGSQTLADADDTLGAIVPVPAGAATYRAVLDVDHRLTETRISTASHTELSFTSSGGAGARLPDSWFCPAATTATQHCTVLPVLQARASVPVSLTDTTPTGVVPVSVQVSRAPEAAAATATSATLKVRVQGASTWTSVPLHPVGGNRYLGQLSVPAAWNGRTVDTQVTAGDDAGSTFAQTVTAAFAVSNGAAPAATAAAAVTTAATAAATAAGTAAGSPAARAACSAARPGQVRCLSLWRPGAPADRAGSMATRAAVTAPSAGYGPADIAAAYQLNQSTGAGQTVGIVDAFDNPNAESDLAAARAAWGLPPCTTANGCFRKVNQTGGTKPPQGDPGWGVEIALDVQAVSYACPKCHILLVEARTNQLTDMGRATNEAVALGADIVSNSYGTDEFTGIRALGQRFYTHPGTAIVASTGDFGFTAAQFPAVLATTIAVGGTTLTHQGGSWRESAWSGAGSGCSAWIAKPSWQKDKHCHMRVTGDVSAVADPDTGLAVYDTYGLGADNGWIVVGGTSASAPLISGMIGLAGNAASLGDASWIYAHPAGLHDVVGGSNGFCGGDYLCTARKGYDGPTGMGSPRGTSAL